MWREHPPPVPRVGTSVGRPAPSAKVPWSTSRNHDCKIRHRVVVTPDGVGLFRLASVKSQANLAAPPVATQKRKGRRVGGKNAPSFPVTDLLRQLCGVDLSTIPGLSAPTLQGLWSELGSTLASFPTAKHFASWLSLCPDNKISGGRKLRVSTRATANRVARMLRVAAPGVGHAHNEIGDFYQRMRAKLGGAAAITATAHKLTRILYACLRNKQPYDASRHDQNSPARRSKALAKLRTKAKNLGFQLVELQPAI